MTYNELKDICFSKNIKLKNIYEQVGYTRSGFKPAIENETIELRKLKILCEVLRISPARFFDNGTFGIINTVPDKKNSPELDQLRNENELLKSQIEDKNQIIELLKANQKK